MGKKEENTSWKCECTNNKAIVKRSIIEGIVDAIILGLVVVVPKYLL